MVSPRTAGREKRRRLIVQMISILLEWAFLSKQDLETIPLPFMKKIKKSLEDRRFEVRASYKYIKK